MTANQVIAAIVRIELNARYAPDFRRLIGHEREVLTVAVRSGDAARIAAAKAEAERVAELWGADLGGGASRGPALAT